MAYPAGVTTRSITFSDVTTSEDGTQTASITRVIVQCNKVLVHTATGVELLPVGKIFTATPFTLPVTDQVATWTDSNGKVLTSPTHSYNVAIEWKNPNTNSWELLRSIKNLLVPTSGTALDLDTQFNTDTQYTTG